MKLATYMARNGLDDETMARLIREHATRPAASAHERKAGSKCDRSLVSRWRRLKRRPDWPAIKAIADVTKQAVTADDWMELENAA